VPTAKFGKPFSTKLGFEDRKKKETKSTWKKESEKCKVVEGRGQDRLSPEPSPQLRIKKGRELPGHPEQRKKPTDRAISEIQVFNERLGKGVFVSTWGQQISSRLGY